STPSLPAFPLPAALPLSTAATNLWLHFLGINYRANVWLNGQKIADERDVAGTYRSYEFDVTKVLLPRQTNALALEISAPRKNDRSEEHTSELQSLTNIVC